MKPSKITSQASSLPNSSLHLRPLNQDEPTTGSLIGIAVDKNSSIEDSSASSSSIDTQNQASNSSSSSKFNLDQLLGVGSTTTHHERSPPSTIANKPDRESLLPPPPPIPSARSTNLASLTRAPSNATAVTTSTTKLPGLPTTAPPQVPPPPSASTTSTSSRSVLVSPLQPPPPLPQPHQTPNTHSPPNSISPTSTSPIVSSDASNHIKSSSIRLRVENEIRLEQAMSQLGCDRVRAACVLYLAGSDLKLAKSILKSSINEN